MPINRFQGSRVRTAPHEVCILISVLKCLFSLLLQIRKMMGNRSVASTCTITRTSKQMHLNEGTKLHLFSLGHVRLPIILVCEYIYRSTFSVGSQAKKPQLPQMRWHHLRVVYVHYSLAVFTVKAKETVAISSRWNFEKKIAVASKRAADGLRDTALYYTYIRPPSSLAIHI